MRKCDLGPFVSDSVRGSVWDDIRKMSHLIARLYNDNISGGMDKVEVASRFESGESYRWNAKVRCTQVFILKALDDVMWCPRICNAAPDQVESLKRGGVSQAELAKHLGVDPATMCRNIRALASVYGWVEQVSEGHTSKREKMFVLTESGRSIVREAMVRIEEVDRRLEEALAADGHVDLKAMASGVRRVLDIMRDLENGKKDSGASSKGSAK